MPIDENVDNSRVHDMARPWPKADSGCTASHRRQPHDDKNLRSTSLDETFQLQVAVKFKGRVRVSESKSM